MRDIERAWRSHLDEILYRQSDSLDAPSLNDALERPDIDLELGSPPEFSFDPTTRRSRRDQVEDVDDQGGDANGDGYADRQPQRGSDPRQ